MTFRLDARQLDQIWDASVRGTPLPFPVEDLAERRLFQLLGEVDRPAASPAFFRELDRQLVLEASAGAISTPTERLTAPFPPKPSHAAHPKFRPSARGSIPAYALAAVALLLILSTVVIALPRFGSESERSIPAVPMWEGDGPPTAAEVAPAVDGVATPGPQSSPGLQSTTLFAHSFTPEELTNYQFDQWSWIGLAYGSVTPGGQAPTEDVSEGAGSTWTPGVQVIQVETGSLEARPNGAAILTHGTGGGSEEINESADVTLSQGDSLMFAPDAMPAIWNPNAEPATYISSGLNSKKDYPILIPNTAADDSNFGFTGDRSIFARTSLLDLSIERILIAPGETYAYAITSNTLLMSSVTGEGLQLSRWLNANESDNLGQVSSTIYSLHEYGNGHYTLTNTGSETVDIYLLEVAPSVSGQLTDEAPGATVELLFSKTLTPDEMALYESDKWKWISFSQGTLQPGNLAIIAEGSPTASEVGSDLNGLGAITVTSGELVANAASGAVIERSTTGAIEPVDRRADVTLETGDTLIAPANTLPAIWNRSDAEASYLAGGVYIKRNISPLNELGFELTKGGISVHPNDLAVGAPVTMSLQQVTIPPGASYAYTVNPATWLEAIVSGGELRQEKSIDGIPQGTSKTLVISLYSLHSDGTGDYTLTNDGTETVEISFFRVEAQGSPNTTGSPVVSQASKLEQSAN